MKTFVKTLLVLVLALAPALGQQIQTGKSVMISIAGVPEEEKGRITGPYRVADNGTINMPFIGPVRAAGMKPEVLASTLEARFRAAQIYRNPTFQVVADMEGAALDEAVVVLGGQVARPGAVKFQRGLTLWQAIQNAGGPTPFGTIKRVTVTRAGKQRQHDLTQIQGRDTLLEPNDGIEIPQKRPWEPR
jgi:protein involved in polysaccharide export with SLBB domain